MPSDAVATLIRAAQAGAAILRESFARLPSLAVSEKGPSDFVSQADLRSEAAIKAVITAADPGARFQAEETTEGRVTTGRRYLIDPLDGTTNFLSGIPHFAVSVALADEGGILGGVVLEPNRDEVFWAERGQGAYLGTTRLRVSARSNLEAAVIHTGVPHRGRGDHPVYLEQLRRLMVRVAGVRRFGSAAMDLAYVAAGRGDGFFEVGLSPWDIAAGILLVQEASGLVTDFARGDAMFDRSELVAASPLLHGPLLRTVLGPAA